MVKLTEKEAFDTMMVFLEKFYESTKSNDVGVLLGSMIVLEDGGTADPTVWGEWLESVQKGVANDGARSSVWLKDFGGPTPGGVERPPVMYHVGEGARETRRSATDLGLSFFSTDGDVVWDKDSFLSEAASAMRFP